MIEVQVAEINIFIKEHKMKNDYNVKIINDPLIGKKIALYKLYSNGTHELVVQSRNKEKIISYLSIKENN